MRSPSLKKIGRQRKGEGRQATWLSVAKASRATNVGAWQTSFATLPD